MYDEFDLRERCEDEEDYDSRFIKLINNIFKEFIKEYSYKYEGLELDVPEYLNRPEFDIDYSIIDDSEISSLLKKSETYKEIYRILANFFRKPRKKSSSAFFDDNLLNQLNIQIQKLKRVVIGDVIYESLFPSFGEFIGSNPNETGLIENQEDFISDNRLNKAEKVNLLIGSFQPIHNGHIKAIESLKHNNGLPCVIVSIIRKNKNNPLSERTIRILLEKVQREYPELIKDIRIINYSSIKDVLKCLKPEYDPILWGTSKKRINDYILQLDYIKKKDLPLRLSEDFKLVEIPSYQDSDKVLNSILDQDYSLFKKSVPKSIGSEFFNLQSELKSNVEN
jgi:cytidyltransferase-like protein